MVFENLRKNKFDEEKKAFCMNCGAELTDKSHNIFARRFCSMQCHEAYVKPSEEE